MSITFEGVELMFPEPFGWISPGGTKTLLETGYWSVQPNDAMPFERTLTCKTTNISDITRLEAKKGVLGLLIIDGWSYWNVGIVDNIIVTRFGQDNYEYTVSFCQSI